MQTLVRWQLAQALARARGSGSGGAAGALAHQNWNATQVTVNAGTSGDVTDTTNTLTATRTGVFLLNGMIPCTCGAGSDNGSFAIVQHSLDGGATWVPVTNPSAGDQRCLIPALPPPGGVAGATTSTLSFAFIVSIPAAVGNPQGIKFKVVLSASGGNINTSNGTTTAGRGQLTATEIA